VAATIEATVTVAAAAVVAVAMGVATVTAESSVIALMAVVGGGTRVEVGIRVGADAGDGEIGAGVVAVVAAISPVGASGGEDRPDQDGQEYDAENDDKGFHRLIWVVGLGFDPFPFRFSSRRVSQV